MKGAAFTNFKLSTNTQISIHAPVKGATRPPHQRHSFDADFNPRSREGSDQIGHLLGKLLLPISIHAPVKGATSQADRDIHQGQHFNPRSREGSDLTCPDGSWALTIFQSTLP